MRVFKFTLLLCFGLGIMLNGQTATHTSPKLKVAFNTNVEFLGFLYFLAYENDGIEAKTMTIDGQEVPKKAWHNYGHAFAQKYAQHLSSPNLAKGMAVADHLWLDYLNGLLLRIDDFPNAKIPADLNEVHYLSFSKTKDPEEALKNVTIFLESLNALYKEIDFDAYLQASKIYYDKALEEVISTLPQRDFIQEMEDYFQEAFEAYKLVPTLTTPKGMGFGPKDGKEAYNIFGAFDWQTFEDPNNLQMGFANPKELRELSIHEFGHSFVNPKVAMLPDSLFKATESLFLPIQERMEEQGYNTWKSCIYEHFVRACEIIQAKKHATKGDYKALKKAYIEGRQFIYIPTIIEVIEDYKAKGWTFQKAVYEAMVQMKTLVK